MPILFNNGTPRGLARFLIGHTVEEARARGWEELANGDLIEVSRGVLRRVRTDVRVRERCGISILIYTEVDGAKDGPMDGRFP